MRTFLPWLLLLILFAVTHKFPSPGQAVAAEKKKVVHTDCAGDPLPEGIVARLGTVRFRHTSLVTTVSFVSDGKVIASESQDRLDGIHFWDATSGKELLRLPAWTGRFGSNSFSTDGKLLASEGPRLFDVATGKERTSIPRPPREGFSGFAQRTTVALCPDGKTLVWSGEHGGIHLWDVAEGKERAVLGEKQGPVSHLLLADHGKKLASGHGQAVCLWDLASRALLQTIRITDKGTISALAVSPDGKIVATCPPIVDRRALTIHLWDAATGKVIRILDGSSDELFDFLKVTLAFAPDGKQLAVTCGMARVRLWDVPTGKELQPIQGISWWVSGTSFSPDGKRLAIGDGHAVRLYDLDTGKDCHPLLGGTGGITGLAFSADGKFLATSDSGSVIRLWDPRTGKERRQIHFDKSEFSELNFAPGGNSLFALDGADSSIRVWNALEQTWLPSPKLDFEATDFAFSPDGKYLIIRRQGGRGAFLWDLKRASRVRAVDQLGIFSPVFSPDGKAILLGDDTGLASWNVQTGKLIRRFGEQKLHISKLAFSPDGSVLAMGLDEGEVCLWDHATGKEIRTLRPPKEEGRSMVMGMAFSPNGKTLATARGDKVVRLWEVLTGQERSRFEDHQVPISSVLFAPDGRLLAMVGGDSTVLTWDVTRLMQQSRTPPPKLDTGAVQRLWSDLSGADAKRAYQAVTALAALPEQSVPWLAEHLRQPLPPKPEKLSRLIADLDADEFAVRERATLELRELGDLAAPALRNALAQAPSTEIRRRIGSILAGLDPEKSPDRLRALRAVEVLEYAATPEAKQVLKKLAAGARESRLTQEARAVMDRLGNRPAP
jgi:WD40 repeat protein